MPQPQPQPPQPKRVFSALSKTARELRSSWRLLLGAGEEMFPEFIITSIDERNKSVLGSLSRTEQGAEHWIDKDWRGALLRGTTIAFGRWDKHEGQWRFIFEEKEWGKLALVPGMIVHAVDGYWGERIALVYAKDIRWQKVLFVTAGVVDHVHCAICWATISADENSEYSKGGQNYTVCQECYRESAGPQNLKCVWLCVAELVASSGWIHKVPSKKSCGSAGITTIAIRPLAEGH